MLTTSASVPTRLRELGYGTTQYGPYRLSRALASAELPYAAQGARLALEYGDPVDALATHAGIRLRGLRRADEYERWLDLAHGWATQLDVAPGRLEMLMFSDDLEGNSFWRPQRR